MEKQLYWNRKYGDRSKKLSVEEYLNKVEPYSKCIMNNLKKSNSWKYQLTIASNFMSFTDKGESMQCIQKVIT